jgi:hypothetical protein
MGWHRKRRFSAVCVCCCIVLYYCNNVKRDRQKRAKSGAFLSALARRLEQFIFPHIFRNFFYIVYIIKKWRKTAKNLFTKDFTKGLFLLQSRFLFTKQGLTKPKIWVNCQQFNGEARCTA